MYIVQKFTTSALFMYQIVYNIIYNIMSYLLNTIFRNLYLGLCVTQYTIFGKFNGTVYSLYNSISL